MSKTHPLPWHLDPPDEAFGGLVVDATGKLVAEFSESDDDTIEDSLISLLSAANRHGKPVCSYCDQAATCFGSYDNSRLPAYACDSCCGHGSQGGSCELLAAAPEGGG